MTAARRELVFLALLRSLISARYSWRGSDIVKTKTLSFVDSFFVVVRCSGAFWAARDVLHWLITVTWSRVVLRWLVRGVSAHSVAVQIWVLNWSQIFSSIDNGIIFSVKDTFKFIWYTSSLAAKSFVWLKDRRSNFTLLFSLLPHTF